MNIALKKLDKSGIRPGQTGISKSRIKEIVDDYNSLRAESYIYKDATGRYLVEGHHTTVAATILNKGTGINMNKVSSAPSLQSRMYIGQKNGMNFGKQQ